MARKKTEPPKEPRKRVLVTGGAVHAHLDAVKIITNRFKGGLMASLVGDILKSEWVHLTYLCPKDSKEPVNPGEPTSSLLEVVHHDGFYDYRAKVLDLAKECDAVILGAAVCNLIPASPFKGKFPSHNYRPGDKVPIDFVIAPRVIDEVRSVMRKSAHLFGFKLLSGVERRELVDAAYEVLLGSRATAVFANDAKDLEWVEVIGKDKSARRTPRDLLADEIRMFCGDIYYHTGAGSDIPEEIEKDGHMARFLALLERNMGMFKKSHGEILFGTVAMRIPGSHEFLVTGRGKRELHEISLVQMVDHTRQEVTAWGMKPSLNTPLLEWIFRCNHKVHTIIHVHEHDEDLPVHLWAPPGTLRDSTRKELMDDQATSFNIEAHGVFYLYDKDGNQI